MRWALTRGAVIGIAGLLMGAVASVWVYAVHPSMRLTLERDASSVVAGLYPVETDPSGLSFAWSREEVVVDLPGLNRQADWRVVLVVRGARPPGVPQPSLIGVVDGVEAARAEMSNTFQAFEIPVPARESSRSGARVVIRGSPTFTPGGGDTRALGVQVDEITVEPAGDFGVLPPRSLLVDAALAAGVAAAAFGLVRVTAGSAITGAGLLAVGQAVVLARGAAPYSALPGRAVTAMLMLAAVLVAGIWSVEWRMGERLRNTARFAAIFTVAAVYLKLLVLWHPGIDARDALFQAHRFEWVLSGRYYFTSVAPGDYEFPYAIALYWLAAPFSRLVSDTAGLMDVLRGVVAAADGVAGLLLYPLLLRAGRSRLAAAVAVALYHLMPLNFAIQWVANQTNAFGQSMFVASAAGLVFAENALVGTASTSRRRQAAVLGALTLGWATTFLSHTSSFAIGLGFMSMLMVLALAARRSTLAVAVRVAVVAAVALAAAWWLYYVHFWDVYAAQYARIAGELAEPAAASDPGGRSVLERAVAVPRYVTLYFGLPIALLAAWGGGVAWRHRSSELHTLVLWAWVASCAAFLVLGVLTPVDMRYYLAALPVVAWLAALSVEWLWARGPWARALALALVVWASWNGIQQWLEPLRG